MLDHFRMFADYNRWANRLIYAAAAELTDAELRENRGAFFGSLLATLNHILVADRVWMKRFTHEGEAPTALDTMYIDQTPEPGTFILGLVPLGLLIAERLRRRRR